jgi:hypothetical protein
MHARTRTILPFLVAACAPLALLAAADRAAAQAATGAKKSAPSRNLYAKIAKAIKADNTSQTDMTGMGDQPFKEVWKSGGYLVGLEFSYGVFAGNKLFIRSLRPIYQTADGQKRGALRGVASNAIKRVVAKPGYAIGTLTVSSGLNVDGFEATFMKIDGESLDLDKSYKSEWYGSKGMGEGKKLGGDGALVIGIFGKTSGLRAPQHQLQGLGQILLKD